MKRQEEKNGTDICGTRRRRTEERNMAQGRQEQQAPIRALMGRADIFDILVRLPLCLQCMNSS
ncbi:hypothetical protein L798_01168 [Zootermopsis nevadensis]|uniref:Uncharacterized protein n=1 Tax=Zootermopsis nevadensis TaxID=136037 RepID=A0A067RGZ4_ZOONE|nr:hypothetical protein L798_01168 [Zootermopsis nevadensis]